MFATQLVVFPMGGIENNIDCVLRRRRFAKNLSLLWAQCMFSCRRSREAGKGNCNCEISSPVSCFAFFLASLFRSASCCSCTQRPSFFSTYANESSLLLRRLDFHGGKFIFLNARRGSNANFSFIILQQSF